MGNNTRSLKPDNQTTRQPDNQTTRQPDNQTTRQPDNQTTRQRLNRFTRLTAITKHGRCEKVTCQLAETLKLDTDSSREPSTNTIIAQLAPPTANWPLRNTTTC